METIYTIPDPTDEELEETAAWLEAMRILDDLLADADDDR
jgi:hypothetical protein